MQSPSVRCDVQIYGSTSLAIVWQVHRFARIVRARLRLGRRSRRRQCLVQRYGLNRRVCVFRGSRA
eukprot:6212573-Pleurochrysis_carterae.AAC.3